MQLQNLQRRLDNSFENKTDEEIMTNLKTLLEEKPKERDVIITFAIGNLLDVNLKLELVKMYQKDYFCFHSFLFFKTDEDKIKAQQNFSIPIPLVYLYNSLEDKSKIIPLLKANEILNPNYQPERKQIEHFSKDIPPSLTFGIELEAENGNARIIRELKRKPLGTWNVENDDSLITNSIEITSPILTYTEDNLNELNAVLNFMKANDLTTGENCSTHIHFGASIFKAKQELTIFLYLFCACEEILFLLSNKENSFPRQEANYYAQYITNDFLDAFISGALNPFDNTTFEEYVQRIQIALQPDKFRYKSINILNIGSEINTIEFRLPNGTLDFETIHQNIKLFASFLLLAKELSQNFDIGISYIDKLLQLNINSRANTLIKRLFKDKYDQEHFKKRWQTNYAILKYNNSPSIKF